LVTEVSIDVDPFDFICPLLINIMDVECATLDPYTRLTESITIIQNIVNSLFPMIEELKCSTWMFGPERRLVVYHKFGGEQYNTNHGILYQAVNTNLCNLTQLIARFLGITGRRSYFNHSGDSLIYIFLHRMAITPGYPIPYIYLYVAEIFMYMFQG
jgi:hypothetical protein